MPHPDSRILIVGGGPVGLGLAIELGQRNVPVTLVERYLEPSPIPRGQNLTQRTMEHMLAWGTEAELRAARTIPPSYGIGGLTAYGTLLGDHHYDWLQREKVRAYYRTDNERLPQYATEAVLRDRAAALPHVETLYGWGAETITQDAEGVAVEIVERGGTGRQRLRGAYAVGCDGSRSPTREQSGITQTRADHDRLMVLLVFRSTGLHDLLARFPGKSFFNVLHPDLKGYWQFFGRVDLGSTWFFHAPVAPDTTKDADFRPLLFAAAGAEFDVEMMHVGFWDLRFALADRYRTGRIFVAGDAAHSHPPYGGYGINTGFEDARNLGWKLAAVHEGWAGDDLLDSYDAERRPVFASTARDFIERSIASDRDFLATFDPRTDEGAFDRAWKERAAGTTSEVGSFEPNYEGSPIVAGGEGMPSAVGSHRFEARAGHHLAPATLPDGRNAVETLGSTFTLLALGAASDVVDAFVAAAARLGVPLDIVVAEAGGESARYGAPLTLVRPDHFVAWSGHEGDPEAILGRAVGR